MQPAQFLIEPPLDRCAASTPALEPKGLSYAHRLHLRNCRKKDAVAIVSCRSHHLSRPSTLPLAARSARTLQRTSIAATPGSYRVHLLLARTAADPLFLHAFSWIAHGLLQHHPHNRSPAPDTLHFDHSDRTEAASLSASFLSAGSAYSGRTLEDRSSLVYQYVVTQFHITRVCDPSAPRL